MKVLIRILRIFILSAISVLPLNSLRVFFYRIYPGYKIGKKVKIGWLSFIDVKTAEFADYSCIRGLFNIFMNLGYLYVGRYARIGAPRAGFNLAVGYGKGKFIIGDGTHIELFHYFDLSDDIVFKENVVVGGIHSVFFTHTLYKKETEPIVIGRDSFLASNVRLSQGCNIPDNSVVAMGSVVTKAFTEPGTLIGGNPAKIIKDNFEYNAKDAFELRNIEYINE